MSKIYTVTKLEPQTITRWDNGNKEEFLDVRPQIVTPHRAKTILQISPMMSSLKMAKEEEAFFRNVWDVMPDHCSLYSAVCAVAQGRVKIEPENHEN